MVGFAANRADCRRVVVSSARWCGGGAGVFGRGWGRCKQAAAHQFQGEGCRKKCIAANIRMRILHAVCCFFGGNVGRTKGLLAAESGAMAFHACLQSISADQLTEV